MRASCAVADFELHMFSAFVSGELKILANAVRGLVIIFEIVGRRGRPVPLLRVVSSGEGPLGVTGETGLTGCSVPASRSSCTGRSERRDELKGHCIRVGRHSDRKTYVVVGP